MTKAKKTVSLKKKDTAETVERFYKNSNGIFKLVDGKLFDSKGEKTSSREASKKGDMLKRCDEKGKLLVEPRVKITKN